MKQENFYYIDQRTQIAYIDQRGPEARTQTAATNAGGVLLNALELAQKGCLKYSELLARLVEENAQLREQVKQLKALKSADR